MGSVWPNAAHVLLVRHVQLIRRRQVAYLYLLPIKLLALLTTSLRVTLDAVYTSPEVLGRVSDTSEGSFGPALPSV
jgi:hypothetical protein